MMQGFVNQNCEAMIRVAVGDGNSPKQMIEAVEGGIVTIEALR